LSQKKAPLHRNIFVAMQQNICYMRFIEVAETHSRLWRFVAMSDTATTTIPSFEPVLKALKDVTGQFQFGTAAREYVERSASRAQESLTKYHDNATSFSRSLEVSAFHGIETYANISRNAAELAYRNAQAQLGLVQSLAGVKSFEEGVRVYTDYLKNANETNLAALRGAADYVKDRVTEGATNARENLAKVFPRAA
jgi:hypothetical protein